MPDMRQSYHGFFVEAGKVHKFLLIKGKRCVITQPVVEQKVLDNNLLCLNRCPVFIPVFRRGKLSWRRSSSDDLRNIWNNDKRKGNP